MFGLGVTEMIIILLAVGILLFGSKKIVELSRSLGRASGEFKKGKQDIEKELKEAEREAEEAEASDTPQTALPANAQESERSKGADGRSR